MENQAPVEQFSTVAGFARPRSTMRRWADRADGERTRRRPARRPISSRLLHSPPSRLAEIGGFPLLDAAFGPGVPYIRIPSPEG